MILSPKVVELLAHCAAAVSVDVEAARLRRTIDGATRSVEAMALNRLDLAASAARGVWSESLKLAALELAEAMLTEWSQIKHDSPCAAEGLEKPFAAYREVRNAIEVKS